MSSTRKCFWYLCFLNIEEKTYTHNCIFIFPQMHSAMQELIYRQMSPISPFSVAWGLPFVLNISYLPQLGYSYNSYHRPLSWGVSTVHTHTVFFKTRGHLSRLAWPTQRDGLSCLASPRLALRCAVWPGKTNPDPCPRPVATSGCSHRYYNGIVHNAKCINIPFFSVRQVVFLYKNGCLK